VIEPTGKSFEVVFSTVARWRDGKIVQEYLNYDNATFMANRSVSPDVGRYASGMSRRLASMRRSTVEAQAGCS
jgi:hypothetical protein